MKLRHILVLGPHRSGTSLVASMLDRLGVGMGKELLGGDRNNPEGYFEDKRFLEMNKKILETAGGDWTTIFTVPQIGKIKERVVPEMIDLLKREHVSGLRGWKDPRNCYTVWLWHSLLSDPRYIVVHRNRGDTVRSLRRIYGEGNWEALIKQYDEHIRTFLDLYDPPALHVSYDNLLDDSLRLPTALSLAEFIGRPGLAKAAASLVRSD